MKERASLVCDEKKIVGDDITEYDSNLCGYIRIKMKTERKLL